MRKTRHSNAQVRQRGFALVIVLWLGLLLALVAAVFANSVRGTLRETTSRANRLQASALADAGIRIAMLGLANPDVNAKYAPRYRTTDWVIACNVANAGTLRIEIEDEEGKINLNTSNDELLIALFSGLGASDKDSRTYVDKILDFRDFDNERRAFGAERDDYAKSENSISGPKNSDFLTIGELDQVIGIPPDMRARAKPFITTLSQQPGVDAARMSTGLAVILNRGDASALLGDVVAKDTTLPTSFLSVSTRQNFLVIAEAFLPTGARYAAEAQLQFPDDSGAMPVIRKWQQTGSRLPNAPPPLDARSLPPC